MAEFVQKRGRPPKHGMSGTPTYHAWAWMRAACNRPNNPLYPTTGAKGIGYCAKWDTFEGFLDDMGERPEAARLCRQDTSKDYDKTNCFWQEPTKPDA